MLVRTCARLLVCTCVCAGMWLCACVCVVRARVHTCVHTWFHAHVVREHTCAPMWAHAGMSVHASVQCGREVFSRGSFFL